ncbi:MAG: hypothetical protein LC620_05240, partial [Halobacteriales archaeon]|nr:hypothetical protein [Halobacteriales archaeon]
MEPAADPESAPPGLDPPEIRPTAAIAGEMPAAPPDPAPSTPPASPGPPPSGPPSPNPKTAKQHRDGWVPFAILALVAFTLYTQNLDITQRGAAQDHALYPSGHPSPIYWDEHY